MAPSQCECNSCTTTTTDTCSKSNHTRTYVTQCTKHSAEEKDPFKEPKVHPKHQKHNKFNH